MPRESILSRVLAVASADIVEAKVQELRGIERAHPYLPTFDEGTLPARRPGEVATAWRRRQLDVLQAWVRKITHIAESVETRARCSLALKQGGAA